MSTHPQDPMSLTKEQYQETIDKISLKDSPVGIDAQLTHAIIIKYLQQIESRVMKIEQMLEARGQ